MLACVINILWFIWTYCTFIIDFLYYYEFYFVLRNIVLLLGLIIAFALWTYILFVVIYFILLEAGYVLFGNKF